MLLGSVPLALSGALIFTFLNVTTINIFTLIVVPVLYSLLASEKQTETQSDRDGAALTATPA